MTQPLGQLFIYQHRRVIEYLSLYPCHLLGGRLLGWSLAGEVGVVTGDALGGFETSLDESLAHDLLFLLLLSLRESDEGGREGGGEEREKESD